MNYSEETGIPRGGNGALICGGETRTPTKLLTFVIVIIIVQGALHSKSGGTAFHAEVVGSNPAEIGLSGVQKS